MYIYNIIYTLYIYIINIYLYIYDKLIYNPIKLVQYMSYSSIQQSFFCEVFTNKALSNQGASSYLDGALSPF